MLDKGILERILMQYRFDKVRCEFLESEVERVEAEVASVPAAKFDREPAGASGRVCDPTAAKAALLDGARRAYQDAALLSASSRVRLVKMLSLLPDEQERQVLARRYLEGKTAAQTAAELNLVERRVYQIYGKAMRYFCKNLSVELANGQKPESEFEVKFCGVPI